MDNVADSNSRTCSSGVDNRNGCIVLFSNRMFGINDSIVVYARSRDATIGFGNRNNTVVYIFGTRNSQMAE